MVDYKKQYGLNVPGRTEMGNIDLDKRVPYFPEGFNAAGMSTLFDNEVAPPGLGKIGSGTLTKTEESATIPVNPDGTPVKGKVDVATHKHWANIPTVLHGTQRKGLEEQDAMMNYMLTNKHLGKFNNGMNGAVDGAIDVHLRQDAHGKGAILPEEQYIELMRAVENATNSRGRS